ncbi:D-alanyl-D-alanine carboxypeptidase/D-alanyl-D-alanine-endopeptidase [bacterium]|nr:D-alanyl-D-alanine carboxypeptidase/D-alanyl-D-alanine-endopeptidase [bacterium]
MKNTRIVYWTGFILLVILVFTFGCSQPPKPILPVETGLSNMEHLESNLAELFDTPAFANANWGVAIQSLKTGEYLYLRNADKGFLPASNMKIFSSATALANLGSAFQYHTEILTPGRIDSAAGVLYGDLIIRSNGDPTLSSHYLIYEDLPDSLLAELTRWAESLKAQGIHRVEGRLIGDDNAFFDQLLGFGWSWDDIPEWYAAQISALSFNDNCVDIQVFPGDSIGAPARYEIFPKTPFMNITWDVSTVADDAADGIHFRRSQGSRDILIYGSVGISEKNVSDWFSVENPTEFFINVLQDVFENAGVEIFGSALDIDLIPNYSYDSEGSTLLFQRKSPYLKDIVKVVNKVSQNMWAETLLRTLGFEYAGYGNDENSIAVAERFFSRIGISPHDIVIADGSGLSRLNLVTPRQVITLLRYMYRHPTWSDFRESLPIAGVDGTIRRRMRGTLAEGNVRAKTGYISRVRALSGYVTTLDQEDLVFSMIVNNYTIPTSMANNLQDAVCEKLANFSRN